MPRFDAPVTVEAEPLLATVVPPRASAERRLGMYEVSMFAMAASALFLSFQTYRHFTDRTRSSR